MATESYAGRAGIRLRSVIRTGAGNPWRSRPVPGSAALASMLAWVLITVTGTGFVVAMHAEMSAQSRSIARLESEVSLLRTQLDTQPDWAAIAAAVEPSVFTIETDEGLGSGWVAHSDARGSDLITNYHVVEPALTAGVSVVDVKQGDLTIHGTIARVDPNNDLAVVHVREQLPALKTAAVRPLLAQPVMVVGSPLGLGGSASVGVISGFRSLEGGAFVQFSAPISPGNSGGPVVDAHGRVVAVTAAKYVYPGAEALSLGIPVQIACNLVVSCGQ